MSPSSNVQRRNTNRTFPSSFPIKIPESNDGDSTLPLTTHRPHPQHGNCVRKISSRRRKKTTSSSVFPFYMSGSSTVFGMGSLICLIIIMILIVQETRVKHHESATFLILWRLLFSFSSPGQQPQSQSSTAILSKVRILKEDVVMGKNFKIYDVAIAGAGVAGLSAALFAARAGLTVIVLGSSQGLLSQTKRLDNFPSFQGENDNEPGTGPAWLQATTNQAIDFGATFAPPGLLASSIERSRLETLNNDDIFFSMTTPLENYHAWSIIVASGATPRTLGLPKEKDLWGVTLHNCAICDGHLYRGKDKRVLVVGGGDAAFDAAILLARYAGKVTLVHRRVEFSSANNPANLEVIKRTPNIDILTPFVVEEWQTDSNDAMQLTGAILKNSNDGSRQQIMVDGAFVMIGQDPNTQWLQGLGVALDGEGLIKLPYAEASQKVSTLTTQTSISGVFAAGEVTDRIYKQAITASSSGAQAAIDAERWLREKHGVLYHEFAQKRKPLEVLNSPGNTMVVKRRQRQTVSSSDTSSRKQHKRRVSDVVTSNEPKHDDITCDLTQADCIQSVVGNHPVVVFSKPWCPYCRKALEALSLAGLTDPYIIDLSQYPNTQDIQATLKQLTGRRTVPNVFVGGKSIGGGDETAGLQKSGQLVSVLQVAGALATEPTKKESTMNDTIISKESCDLLTEDCFKEILQKYPIVMFSLSWCPECKRSLELLNTIGVEPHIIDLDDYKAISQDIRQHMLNMTGRRSVPNLFVGGEYIGGFYRMAAIHEKGELIPKFEKVGVLNHQLK